MPDSESITKNNGPLAGIYGLVVLLAGGTFWAETGEEAQIADMASEFHEADIIQNERHDDLEISLRQEYKALNDKYHELDKALALLKQLHNPPE